MDAVAGFAGVVGGLVIAAEVLVPSLQSSAAALLGVGLIGVCESGLVWVMARNHRRLGLAVGSVLALGAIVGLVGWWNYSSVALGAFALVAVGFGLWIGAAPAIAIACARSQQLALAPAVALLVSTLGLLAGSSRPSPVSSAVILFYVFAWVWLGMTLIAHTHKEARL